MRTIVINNPGPQGSTGPQGIAGPSGSTQPFNNISGSIWTTTSSLQISGSFLVSGSSTFTNIGPAIFSGSATITGATTMASAIVSGDVTVLGTASINVLQINTTINSTGSNTLGDNANDTQTLYGTVRIPTGSLTVTGSASVTGIFTHGSASLGVGLITTFDGTYINLTRQGVTTFIGAGSAGNSFIGTNSNQPFSFLTNGIGRAQITAGGNVLIGTTTDAGYNLDVNGTVRTGVLTCGNINPSATSNVSGVTIYTGTMDVGTNNDLRLIVPTAAKGVIVSQDYSFLSSPSALLEVKSTTKGFLPPRTSTTASITSPAQGLITYLTGSTNEGLYYYNSGSQVGWHEVLTNTGPQTITGSLSISGSSPSLQLGTSNNVGDFTNPTIAFGSTSNGIYLDSSRLFFKAGGLFSGAFTSDGYVTNQIQIKGALINDLTTAMFIPYRLNAIGLSSGLGGDSSGSVVLITSGSSRLYVSSSGNVGIGTTIPTKRLEIYDSISGDGLAIARGAVPAQRIELIPNDSTVSTLIKGGGNGKPFYIASWANGGTAQPLYFGTNYSNGIDQVRMTIDATGSVGIGTLAPAYKLDVRGEARISSSLTLDSQPIFRVENGFGANVLDVRGSGQMVLGGSSDLGIGTGLGIFTRYSLRVGALSYTDASAILQADSTSRGFLPPRMTNAQRTAISTPAVGLMVYCTDATEGLYIYKSTGWTFIV